MGFRDQKEFVALRVINLTKFQDPFVVDGLGLYTTGDGHFWHFFCLALLILFRDFEDFDWTDSLMVDELFLFVSGRLIAHVFEFNENKISNW